jgi:hypothetical protein
MIRAVRRLAVPLIAVTVLMLGMPGTQAHSSTYVYSGFCNGTTSNLTNQCLDLYRNIIGASQPLVTYNRNISGDSAQEWLPETVGYVTCGENGSYWPFGNHFLDCQYDGDSVAKLHLYESQSWCADFISDAGVLAKCTGVSGVDLVSNGYTMIDVYRTNQESSQENMTGCGNLCGVYLPANGGWLTTWSQWTQILFYQ